MTASTDVDDSSNVCLILSYGMLTRLYNERTVSSSLSALYSFMFSPHRFSSHLVSSQAAKPRFEWYQEVLHAWGHWGQWYQWRQWWWEGSAVEGRPKGPRHNAPNSPRHSATTMRGPSVPGTRYNSAGCPRTPLNVHPRMLAVYAMNRPHA